MKNDYPIIETKRLLLRKWKSQDFAPFYKINSHPKVCQYLPKILTESESNAVVDQRYRTPKQATQRDNCDIIIVGSGIYSHKNPIEMAKKYPLESYVTHV